ncbi:MAG: polyphosphate kinase 1 [Lachnospiraceae bacterium]|nr:polyphosphate kinase 1 [Lachnospiraceae bacterium]
MSPKDKKNELEQKTPDSVFINREVSWLEFNLRVLLEAADPAVPLLERLKFLMIYQSNMEEVFRVRIGILPHRSMLTPDARDKLSGMDPEQEIDECLRIVREQQVLMESIWKELREELKRNRIDLLDFKKISKVDELMSKKLFGDIKGLLSPRILQMNDPLPFFWNGESNIVVFLGKNEDQKLAVIPLDRIPAYLSFEIDGEQKLVLTTSLVRHFLPMLFKRETVTQSAIVEVTRNADVFLTDLEIRQEEDSREKMSSLLSKRKREMPVRVRIHGKLTDSAKALLIRKLRIPEKFVFTQTAPFDMSFRSGISGPKSFKYEEHRSSRDVGLKKGEYFSYIENHDLLLSFPFQSMLPFVDLIYEAADDPEVLSIKITLYRMSQSSKIAAALAYAADRGKDVLCLLELRARFDEQSNIDYSEMLEDAGCRIIYGLPEYKVHSKLCVITRSHNGNLSYITQVGTGNYNEVTGEQYTDLSLITSRKEAGENAEAAFAALLNGEIPPEVHHLWIAPLSFKSRVLEYLDREKSKGSEGKVIIKVNSMNNVDVMNKLIECSQAGVQVELYIRGICCLRPGIPGKTDNIVVKSVVGRWLEHSRIFSFGEGEDQRLFIGSGDFLNRNLERRVEAFIEVVTPETRKQVNEILKAFRHDREKSRKMLPDGSYIREEGIAGTSCQEALYRYFSTYKVDREEEKAEEEAPDSREETVNREEAANREEAVKQEEAVNREEAVKQETVADREEPVKQEKPADQGNAENREEPSDRKEAVSQKEIKEEAAAGESLTDLGLETPERNIMNTEETAAQESVNEQEAVSAEPVRTAQPQDTAAGEPVKPEEAAEAKAQETEKEKKEKEEPVKKTTLGRILKTLLWILRD